MTETTETAPASGASASGGRKGGLNAMLLPELKQLAGGLGIKATGMRKGDLIEAIKAAQGGGQSGGQSGGQRRRQRTEKAETRRRPRTAAAGATPGRPRRPAEQDRASQDDPKRQEQNGRDENRGEQSRGRDDRDQDDREQDRDQDRRPADRRPEPRRQPRRGQRGNRNDDRQNQGGNRQNDRTRTSDRQNQTGNQNDRNQNQDQPATRAATATTTRAAAAATGAAAAATGRQPGRQPGRRGPQRRRPRNRNEPDLQILEDDVLAPCAGILDLMDNYAFVRTSGYLPGVDDVYVSMSMVRKYGLRRGDAVTGQVRQPREGERKEKYNPLVKLDTVNGADPESSKTRVEFNKLTPLYPSERLRLETTSTNLIGRVIDIAAPIGKGQRGLIVSPSKAGKTMIMQSIANSITTNNPECHLMVVLVDERPEEVTDFERSVKGEVVSSTFDRPAGRPHDRRGAGHRAGQAARRARPRRRRAPRRHHPPGPRLQPRRAGQRPDPLRWCRLGGALPAEEVLRRRAQHRGRRLADHPRHRADRERLEDGRGDLRGVQGHRQHGDPAAARFRGQADLPGDRRRTVRYPS